MLTRSEIRGLWALAALAALLLLAVWLSGSNSPLHSHEPSPGAIAADSAAALPGNAAPPADSLLRAIDSLPAPNQRVALTSSSPKKRTSSSKKRTSSPSRQPKPPAPDRPSPLASPVPTSR